ncbi:hypothetical protein H5T51_04300 [Candidatus Bathyarchaeota archaeon]|nr:hypothetical protein [Candidatus Bathyarchaeota archaeon]
MAIKYDLAGLQIYDVKYNVSCKLDVTVLGTDGVNAHIRVAMDDEDKPVINLGKENFKFYLYNYTNSTWMMTGPSTEPIVLEDGTYLIELPSGIDPYSFMVQVKDQRGVVTVASSFSSYTLTLTWNSTIYSLAEAINQEANMALIDHESFEGSWPPDGWDSTGRWNKESDRAYDGAYSADFDGGGNGRSGYLITPPINCYGAEAIYVDFYYYVDFDYKDEFLLQFYNGTHWNNIVDLGLSPEDEWLHYSQEITDSQYLIPTFQIRWYAIDIENGEHVYIDYVTVSIRRNVTLEGKIYPAAMELLQNGTVRWFGENLKLATNAKPIPPVPIKAIRVNQTINGVTREVPFQIEDWSSDYRVPLSLANNASIFNNRNIIVFLVTPNVSQVTIWWDGSDRTVQTPLAYANSPFSYSFGDEHHPLTLSNQILNLDIDFSGDEAFKVVSTVNTSQATAVLMRVNQDTANYGYSKPMYAVLNGTVRAVLHHEVEWPDGGVNTCPNFYSHIVLTVPANVTYYTYQLRLMFLNSSQPRIITDLCPIRLYFSGGKPITENGTLNGYPVTTNATGLFYNFSSACWQHHWSQLNSSLTKGAGIMFTDAANHMLYVFDNIAGDSTGALNIHPEVIEVCPVTSRASVSFTDSLDIMWCGAVVTFDGTTPIYQTNGGGLWMLVEYPPKVVVTTESIP